MRRNLWDDERLWWLIGALFILCVALSGCSIKLIPQQTYDMERERTQIIESYKSGFIDGFTLEDKIAPTNDDINDDISNTY